MSNGTLPWNEPWTFIFSDRKNVKQAMKKVQINLSNYLSGQLGSAENFQIHLIWSHAGLDSPVYQVLAKVLITQKKMDEMLAKQPGAFGEAAGGSTKNPPPPPPPPVQEIIAGMPADMNVLQFRAIHEDITQNPMNARYNLEGFE